MFLESHFKCSFSKRGSIVVIVVAVFVVLFVFLTTFLVSTSSKTYTTKKLGDTTLAREFANSLALLSCQYIKNVELKDKNSDIRKKLSMPYVKSDTSKMSLDIGGKVSAYFKEKLKSGSDDLISLLEKNSGLKNLKWNIECSINAADFKPLDGGSEPMPYSREKTASIVFFISVLHTPPASKSRIAEDYYYVCDMKVVANLIPVLSKFTFYVENALGNEKVDRFNLCKTYADGSLKSSSEYKPWVFFNGSSDLHNATKYSDLVKTPVGLIYLGGGTKSNPIALGLARGWVNNINAKSPYGEEFHFYKNQDENQGYWKTMKFFSQQEAVMTAEIGLCDDISGENRAWNSLLNGYDADSKKHSILKLYGTDGAQSPTMVLGFVNSRFGKFNMYKNEKEGDYNPPTFLCYFDDQDSLDKACLLSTSNGSGNSGESSDQNDFEIFLFYKAMCPVLGISLGNQIDIDVYKKQYSSGVYDECYNKGFLYYLTNNIQPFPYDGQHIISSSDKLANLCGYNSDTSVFTAVPEEYKKVYNDGDIDSLEEMKEFLNMDRLLINTDSESKKNKRISYCVNDGNLKSGGNKITFETYLTKKHLLKNKELDLNGWIVVDTDSGESLDINELKVLSNGGIILKKGDINIKGDIKSQNDAHLTIVALDGSISIEEGANQVDASLIAGGSSGQVKLFGGRNSHDLVINGNIAMSCLNDLEKMKRGPKVNYIDKLSVMPHVTNDENSEVPLLMYDLKISPNLFN